MLLSSTSTFNTDPLPLHLLKYIVHVLAPFITESVSTGVFLMHFKETYISTLLKGRSWPIIKEILLGHIKPYRLVKDFRTTCSLSAYQPSQWMEAAACTTVSICPSFHRNGCANVFSATFTKHWIIVIWLLWRYLTCRPRSTPCV